MEERIRQKMHQGDVQIVQKFDDELPKNLRVIEKQPVALGESSGHRHAITGDYELLVDENNVMYAKIGSDGAMLQHIHESNFTSYDTKEKLPVADHNIITLTPNTTFKIGIHQRYDAFARHYASVQD